MDLQQLKSNRICNALVRKSLFGFDICLGESQEWAQSHDESVFSVLEFPVFSRLWKIPTTFFFDWDALLVTYRWSPIQLVAKSVVVPCFMLQKQTLQWFLSYRFLWVCEAFWKKLHTMRCRLQPHNKWYKGPTGALYVMMCQIHLVLFHLAHRCGITTVTQLGKGS